jgi:YegS/Rv2252/BmrU family lipid kinase
MATDDSVLSVAHPDFGIAAQSRPAGATPRLMPLIVNAGAGAGAARDAAEAAVDMLSAAGIETRKVLAAPGADLRETTLALLRDRPAAVIAAGGDGTINAVASALADSGTPLGVLPLGTLNHFAKDLGIPIDVTEAAHTIGTGDTIDVDVGEVNGRVFLNNSSLGLYPHIVRNREKQQRRLGRGKWPALLWATLTTLRRRPFLNVRLSTDETTRRCTTSFVFIGNNVYTMEGFNIGQRERLDAGQLSLYLTRRCSRFRLVTLAVRALFGRLHQADDFEATTAESIVIETRHKRLHVATDGEVNVLDTPLEYRIRPRALRVLVPASPQRE